MAMLVRRTASPSMAMRWSSIRRLLADSDKAPMTPAFSSKIGAATQRIPLSRSSWSTANPRLRVNCSSVCRWGREVTVLRVNWRMPRSFRMLCTRAAVMPDSMALPTAEQCRSVRSAAGTTPCATRGPVMRAR